MTTTLYLVTGDNRATRSWTVRNGPLATSPAINLTTATAVEIHIVGATPSTITCSFVADATGTVSHSFLTAEIPAAGTYQFETQITFADGTITTVPDPGYDQISVREQGG